jgi:hypothetical protein
LELPYAGAVRFRVHRTGAVRFGVTVGRCGAVRSLP